MAPRARKVQAPEGIVYFAQGTPEDAILEFLEHNKIEEATTDRESSPTKEVLVKVPPTKNDDVYLVPDHVWVWVNPRN